MPDSDGLYCRICNAGPFVKLTTHARRIHGLSKKDYLALYPDAAMIPEIYRANFYAEGLERGWHPSLGQRRKRVCPKGHRLAAPNLYFDSWGRRTCLKCRRATERVARERRKERIMLAAILAHGLILCACGCGTRVPPVRTDGKPRRFADGHNDPRYWPDRVRDSATGQFVAEG
jgi:hypothetical protein